MLFFQGHTGCSWLISIFLSLSKHDNVLAIEVVVN